MITVSSTSMNLAQEVYQVYNEPDKSNEASCCKKIRDCVSSIGIFSGVIGIGAVIGLAAGPFLGVAAGVSVGSFLCCFRDETDDGMRVDLRPLKERRSSELEKLNHVYLKSRGWTVLSDPEEALKIYADDLLTVQQKLSENPSNRNLLRSWRHFLVTEKTKLYTSTKADLLVRLSREEGDYRTEISQKLSRLSAFEEKNQEDDVIVFWE